MPKITSSPVQAHSSTREPIPGAGDANGKDFARLNTEARLVQVRVSNSHQLPSTNHHPGSPAAMTALSGENRKVSQWEQIENVQFLGTGAHINREGIRDTYFSFDSDVQNGKCLNIVAHARMVTTLSTATIGLLNVNTRYTGDAFAIYIRDGMGIDFNKYQQARLFICHSANGGVNSFAQRFAQVTGLETEGHSGEVTTEGELQSMVNAHSSALNLENLYQGNLLSAEEELNEVLAEMDSQQQIFGRVDGYTSALFYRTS